MIRTSFDNEEDWQWCDWIVRLLSSLLEVYYYDNSAYVRWVDGYEHFGEFGSIGALRR